MTLIDLAEYIEKKEEVYAAYEDQDAWNKKVVYNIAKAGFFSSDRTIEQYDKDIWHTKYQPSCIEGKQDQKWSCFLHEKTQPIG